MSLLPMFIPFGGGFQINNASYSGESFDVSSQESSPRALAFKPDGSKMYVIGTDTDEVHQYSLASAWLISSASYDSVSVSAADGIASGVFFKPDGTKMFTVGNSTRLVREFDLSPAWDLTSASASGTFDVSSQLGFANILKFSSDGEKMYVGGGESDDEINQYVLSTAWDVTSASYDTRLSVSSKEPNMYGFDFSRTGEKLFFCGIGNETLYQFSMSTPWDIDTATDDGVSFDMSNEAPPFGIAFKRDGRALYAVANGSGVIYQYRTV